MGDEHHHRQKLDVTIHLPKGLMTLLASILDNSEKVERQLNRIERRLHNMPSQEDFDAQVSGINAKIDTLTTAVSDEAAQVQAFIAAHPDLDTSALQGVADRLDALSTSVTQIDPQA